MKRWNRCHCRVLSHDSQTELPSNCPQITLLRHIKLEQPGLLCLRMKGPQPVACFSSHSCLQFRNFVIWPLIYTENENWWYITSNMSAFPFCPSLCVVYTLVKVDCNHERHVDHIEARAMNYLSRLKENMHLYFSRLWV